MRLLFVFAHPSPDSLSAAALRTACKAAIAVGHQVQVLDLYALGFAPVLRGEEWLDYPDPDAMGPDLDAHVTALQWAEGVIFVYPTWWSGQPAILSGWVHRVWRPGVAFQVAPNGLIPGLPQIRLVGVITSLGAKWWQWQFLLGAPGRKQILRGLRACISPRAATFWLAHYEIDASTPASRAAHLAKIARRIAQIAV